jgi:hypothetical protein
MTAEEYYQEDAPHGGYQYTKMNDLINDYIMSRSSDDYTADTPRYQILYQAMKGLREFYYDILQEIKGRALELSPTLQVTLPQDYVNYVRISWVDDFGQLHPMAMDNKMSIASDYLQDVNYNLLFDEDGCVLLDHKNGNSFEGSTVVDGVASSYEYQFRQNTFKPNINLSNVYENGKYKIDKERGIIQFGSGVQGRVIVLEYISDGLFSGCEGKPEEEIRVNKFAESALLDYIYYQLTKNSRNIPANEKARARKEYHNSRRIAKARINTLRKEELIQTFKGSTKWIK